MLELPKLPGGDDHVQSGLWVLLLTVLSDTTGAGGMTTWICGVAALTLICSGTTAHVGHASGADPGGRDALP